MNQPKPTQYPAGSSSTLARQTTVALGCACLAAWVGRAAAPDSGRADVAVTYRPPARWRLEARPPGLPAWVAFGTEAARFRTLASGDAQPLAGHELTVTGWTNVGPRQLPVRVEAQFFLSLAGPGPRQTIRVETEAFGETAPAVSFVPPLGGDFYVSDSRMWDPHRPISVVMESNAWPAIEDFIRLRAWRLAVRGSMEAKRTAFTLLLAAILILPLVFWWGVPKLTPRPS
ncbi:MAG: hypothetical protein IPM17_09855 [Verrucomicrobia bacterium]|nr:hypothetical protein [Verrucomicrobiota bacterium]